MTRHLPGILVVTIVALAALAFALNLHESVVEIQCARDGYPTTRRVSLTKIACFKVENGTTVQK